MLSVSTSTFIVLIFNIILGLFIPAFLFIYLRKKGAKAKNFWIGALIMLLFAFVLEGIVNMLISPILFPGGLINIWKYAIGGGLMAGLFEETGRFLAYKTVLKKTATSPKDALMYGAGHGGLEIFVILVLTFIGNVFLGILINHGATDFITKSLEGEALSNVQSSFYLLCTTPSSQYLFAAFERISAIITQLSLSVIVWKAATDGRKSLVLYPLAIILHMIINAVAIICSSQFHFPIIVVEAIVFVLAIGIAFLALSLVKKSNCAEK